jgi:hypothetical protein
VLLVSVLHFIADEEYPADLVADYMSEASLGSYIALSHARTDGKQDAADVEQIYKRSPNPMHFRSRPQIAALFGDLTVVEPGVVLMPQWHPELDDELERDIDEDYPALAGVGRRD